MWALYLLMINKYVRSTILFILSVGTKFATLLLVPVFVVIYFLKKYKREINWERMMLLSIVSMLAAVFVVTLRTTFQPWYLLYVLPFVAIVPNKYYVIIPTVIISFAASLQYLPFLYLGNWDSPMDFFRKHKFEIIILSALALTYFVSRFFSILSLPIFTDEAIYVRWAQIAKQDANWRFISLTDGKQPMLIWLMMVSLRIIADPLLAGRIVSVGAGFLTFIGIYFLGREVFKSNKIGLISCALYVIFPMALVYDRMALYDSLVGTFAVWALLLIVLLVRKVRMDIALILGMGIGGGALTKTNAFFSIYLLPFSLLLFDWSKKTARSRLLRWVG